jgi:uncharacterized protein YecE (DUF72 family)
VGYSDAGIHVGCSGWHYEDWRGRVYPAGLARTRWLAYYSGIFDTVELNNTFYRLPSEPAIARWSEITGSEFVFSVKGSRYITHIRRLEGVEAAVKEFMQRLTTLGSKLGPVLWQLPPRMSRDDRRLETFLRLLPRTPRTVIEFRHVSWRNDDVYSMLRSYGVAACLVDTPDFRSPAIATTDFIYVRFHGVDRLYSGSYEDEQLERWAVNIRELSQGKRPVYAYFNNDVNAYAVDNALTLRRLLVAP